MSGFPLIDKIVFKESPKIAALLYLTVTGAICKHPNTPIFSEVDTKSVGSMRALLLDLARPYRNPNSHGNLEFLNGLLKARDFPAPPGNALLSFPLRVFDSLRELRSHLCETHQPIHWYRGQNTQHIAIYEGHVEPLESLGRAASKSSPMEVYTDANLLALTILRGMLSRNGSSAASDPVALDPPGEIRLAFDSLIPSFYRSAATRIPAVWTSKTNHDLPPLDSVTAAARAIMGAPTDHPIRQVLLTFLEGVWRPAMLAAVRRKGGFHVRDTEAEARALPYTNVQQCQLDLISLAQHYGYDSVMVDITTSINVALWFAAFRWKDDSLIGSGSDEFGVVYRFDAEAIKSAIKTNFGFSENNRLIVPHLGLFGMADISETNPRIAMRPKAQHGGSLFGFENSAMHLLLANSPHVQAFAFPHRSADGSETPIRKADLCPADDPALTIFNSSEMSKEQITPNELDRFLRESNFDEALRKQIVHLRSENAL